MAEKNAEDVEDTIKKCSYKWCFVPLYKNITISIPFNVDKCKVHGNNCFEQIISYKLAYSK